jgi:hypothetical protein
MRMFGPTTRWQKRPHDVPQDNGFIDQCMRLWDAGYDTKAIALDVFQPEYNVALAVRLGRERRRREEIDAEWNTKKEDDA